jgi:hypothetical protein
MTGYGPTPWIDQFPVPIAIGILIGGLATVSLFVLIVVFGQRIVFGPRRNNLQGRGLRNFGPGDYREFLHREREEREKGLERKKKKRRFMRRQREMYGEDEEAGIGIGGQETGEEGSEYTLRNYRDKVKTEDKLWELQQKKLDEEFAELAYAVQADNPNGRR